MSLYGGAGLPPTYAASPLMKTDIRRIDLNLLVVFDAIYKSRNLTAAGAALGLSQPAMSHALKRLRWMLQDPLFVRLPRGLQPTPHAEQLAGPVAQGLESIRGTLDRAGFDPSTSKRTFRLAMTDIGEQVFLPALLGHLLRHAPGVAVQTCQITTEDLRDAMASGGVDLALGFIPQLGPGFLQMRLFRSVYACVVRHGHPDIHETLSLKQYREARHALVLSAGTGHGEVIERAMLAKKIDSNAIQRISHFLAIPAILASTDLVATLPRNLAEAFGQQRKLRLLPPPLELPAFDITLYWHARYDLEPGNRWLREVIGKLFRR